MRHKKIVVLGCDGCGAQFERKYTKRYCDKILSVGKSYCSIKCSNSREVGCHVCGKDFIGTHSSKFCSDECFVAYRRVRQLQKRDRDTRIISCKYCGKEHSTYKKATRFCSRSCASKWYIKNTDRLDAWRVVGADKISKGQRTLYESLVELYPNRPIFLEKDIPKTTRSADILFEDCKTVVSFYGDFFHANPSMYSGSDIHPLKKYPVERMWKQDKDRASEIKAVGYRFVVVWESDFNNNREEVLNRIMEEIGG